MNDSAEKPAIAGLDPIRAARLYLRRLSRRIDHDDVVDHVREEGMLSGRYLFMAVMSCAIATLGLLLSSPAVIIGAMLISPLMGPIMTMGFSLSILELSSLRRAVFSMLCGVFAALAISFLIVKLSPLTDMTPEILARTRPNLFDLLVAVFSGLAGGYAVIHRKGETIVGVAIATALMPPLAVTGFGLAVGSTAVAGGAFFLFMTNLLAIALSVTVLSKFYGFGAEHSPRHALWQTSLILLVFAGLSVPLGFALRDIAYESHITAEIRDAVMQPFRSDEAQLTDFAVSFPRGGGVSVVAAVLTREQVGDAEAQVLARLSAITDDPVRLELSQLLANENRQLERENLLRLAETSLAAPLRNELAEIKKLSQSLSQDRRDAAMMRAAIAFPISGADIDPDERTARIFAMQSEEFDLAAYRAMERGLRANFPDWQVTLVPPFAELPLITFDEGAAVPGSEGEAALALSLWALEHWSITSVEVVGYASTAGAVSQFNNASLASRRAEAVAQRLVEMGFEAFPVGEYRAFQQAERERRSGQQRFQSVVIRPRSVQ